MFYTCASRKHGLKYNPFKACVVPRPIGWITTISSTGAVNLAPFSFFNVVSDAPPMVMYCTNGSHVAGGPKDSLRNVLECGEFVANLATWDLKDAVNATSADAAPGVNEMELAGLEPAPSVLGRPPRVRASPINLECTLHQVIELPPPTPPEPNFMVLGNVVGVHIDDSIVRDGLVDITLAKPIARLGYMDFAVIKDVFTMRPPHHTPMAL